MSEDNRLSVVKRTETNVELEALKKLKVNSPRMRYRYRLEAFRFFIYIFWPITAVWAFNQPFFQEKSLEFLQQFMRQFGVTEESMRYNSNLMKSFKQRFAEAKQREEYAKLLREQMEFESDRRFREKFGI